MKKLMSIWKLMTNVDNFDVENMWQLMTTNLVYITIVVCCTSIGYITA